MYSSTTIAQSLIPGYSFTNTASMNENKQKKKIKNKHLYLLPF